MRVTAIPRLEPAIHPLSVVPLRISKLQGYSCDLVSSMRLRCIVRSVFLCFIVVMSFVASQKSTYIPATSEATNVITLYLRSLVPSHPRRIVVAMSSSRI